MGKAEAIRTEEEYQAALRRVSELMDARRGEPESWRRSRLSWTPTRTSITR